MPRLPVVELAEQQARAQREVGDVARARVEGAAGLQDRRDSSRAFFRAPEMLDHVEHDDAVVARVPELLVEVAVEVERDRLRTSRVARALEVDRRDVRDLLRQQRAQPAAARADVGDLPVRRPVSREDVVVQRVLRLLEDVARLLEAAEVELRFVVEAEILEACLRHGLHAVDGVPHLSLIHI